MLVVFVGLGVRGQCTDITFCLVVILVRAYIRNNDVHHVSCLFPSCCVPRTSGGLSDKKQAVELRHSPDIVIATPGRLIDHIHNTQSFDLQGIEILIMDEVWRYVLSCRYGGSDHKQGVAN